MYTKQDPYGTIQRWVSDYIEGPWEQIDDRFYASEEALNYNENDLVVCKNIIEDNKHTYRFFNEVIEKNSYLLIPEGKNEKYVFGKHYEGTSIATWGDKKILYSDHYEINNSLEVGNTKTTESVNRVAGIYYSELELNYNNKTNLGYLEDHIRFNIFYKLNTINTEMRPKSSQGNQLRNGWILSLKDVKEQGENISQIKEVIKNASEFNLSKTYYKQENGKTTVIVKSNRAICKNENEEWVRNGWKYATEMYENQEKYDSDVDESIRNIFVSYLDKNDINIQTAPYGIDEIFLYKVFDNTAEEILKVRDYLGNEKKLKIEIKNPVSGITINKENLNLYTGDIETLLATVYPENASNKNIIWSSSNEEVVSVNQNGEIIALKPGNAIITVKTKDGEKEATCVVTVEALDIKDAKIILNQSKFTYNGKEHKPEINEVYISDKLKLNPNDYSITYKNNIYAGEATVIITGIEKYIGNAECKFEILKAKPTYTIPSGMSAIYGSKLKDIKLPEGFKWEDDEEKNVGNVGNNIFYCTYTPNDISNYEIVKNIPVMIKVFKITNDYSNNIVQENKINNAYYNKTINTTNSISGNNNIVQKNVVNENKKNETKNIENNEKKLSNKTIPNTGSKEKKFIIIGIGILVCGISSLIFYIKYKNN